MKKTFSRILISLAFAAAMILASSALVFAGGSSSSGGNNNSQPDYSGYACHINGTYYSTLQAAVNACPNATWITLNKNITESITLEDVKAIGIYMNGKTWTAGSDGYCFYVSKGSLAVNGNSNGCKLYGGEGVDYDGHIYGGIGICDHADVRIEGKIQLFAHKSYLPDYGAYFVNWGGTLHLEGEIYASDEKYTKRDCTGFFYCVGGTTEINNLSRFWNCSGRDGFIYLTDAATFSMSCGKDLTGDRASISNYQGDKAGVIQIAGNNCTVNISGNVYFSGCKSLINGGVLTVSGSNNSFNLYESADITDCSASKEGGALYVTGSGNKINIYGSSTITSCAALGGGGGAVSASGDGTVNIYGSARIESCKAANGGAVYLCPANGKAPSLNIYGDETTKNIISGCSATYSGGAVYSEKGNVSIYNNSRITDNTAANGDALYAVNSAKVYIYSGYKSSGKKYTVTGSPVIKNTKDNTNLGSLISITGCSDVLLQTNVDILNTASKYNRRALDLSKCKLKISSITGNANQAISIKGFSSSSQEYAVKLDESTMSIASGATLSFDSVSCADAPLSISAKSSFESNGVLKFSSCSGKGAGAIKNYGTLKINGSASFVSCNKSYKYSAGAVYNEGTLSISAANTGGIAFTSCNGASGAIYSKASGKISISGAKFSSCESSENGGAVNAPSADVALSNVTIDSCSATGNGGGVYAKNVSVTGLSTIKNCKAKNGGGVYAESFSISGDGSGITGCSASENGGGVYVTNGGSSSNYSYIASCKAKNGAGIYLAGGSYKLNDQSYVRNCAATANGGGIYVDTKASLILSGSSKTSGGKTISGSHIDICTASENGGCIYSAGSTSMSGNSYLNGLSGQSSLKLAKNGGGIYVASGSFDMSGKSYIQHISAECGACVYTCSGSKFDLSGEAVIQNGTVLLYNTLGAVTNRGNGGNIYNGGSFNISCTGNGGVFAGSAQNGGNIYNAGTMSFSMGTIGNGSVPKGLTSASKTNNGTGGDIYAASKSSTTIEGKATLKGARTNEIYAENNASVKITSGYILGKLAGDSSANYDIQGGWYIDRTYVASFVKSPYNVSGVLNDAPSSISPITVYHDKDKATVTLCANYDQQGEMKLSTVKGYEITIPECSAERESWETLTWNTESDGSGTEYKPASSYKINSDLTLYADWTTKANAVRTITVVDPSGVNKTSTLSFNTQKPSVDWSKFSRSMFILDGASLNKDGSGTLIKTGDIIDFGKKCLEVTVYLQWTSKVAAANTTGDTNIINYTDSNILASGSSGTKTETENVKYVFRTTKTSVKIVDAGFVSKEYSFDCWCDDASGKGNYYYVGDSFEFSGGGETKTLYAVWKLKSDVSNNSTKYGQYSEGGGGSVIVINEDDNPTGQQPRTGSGTNILTYKDNFGDYEDLQYGTSDKTAKVMKCFFKRTNYTFAGWSSDSDSSTAEYSAGDTINVQGDPVLYAVWTKYSNADDPREEIKNKSDDPEYDPTEEYKEDDKRGGDEGNGAEEIGGSSSDDSGETGDGENGSGGNGSGGSGSGGLVTDPDNPGGNEEYSDIDGILSDDERTQYYYEAVIWGYNNGIVTGDTSGSFNAMTACSRADMLTFLWRSMGSPTPVTASNPFSDIKASDYYYNAVLWGYEQGIVKGTSPTTFSPNDTCTRAQGLTFLYRTKGEPETSTSYITKFTDVQLDKYYTNSVAWAIQHGITNGTSTTKFSPDQTCSRGDIVTFMYRALGTDTDVSDSDFQ